MSTDKRYQELLDYAEKKNISLYKAVKKLCKKREIAALKKAMKESA